MRKHALSRFLLVMLVTFGMMVSILPVGVRAETSSDWTQTSFTEIADGDVIAITMAKGESVWILPVANTGRTPAADAASVTDGALSADPQTHGWVFTSAEGGFTIGNANGYLNSGNANSGLRADGEASVWTYDAENNYLKEVSTGRYMGVYTNNPDWRTYGSINTNIQGQTLALWKYTGSETVPGPGEGEEPEPEPEAEIVTVAEALAGAEGTSFRVKGVVTLVDGRNIYIQDDTGGICLYLKTEASGISLGDTVIGSGSRTTYKGLPELKNAVIEKSSGLTLSAKETTIGALTAADVCTYVSIKDVSVTEVYDNNGAYSTPNITVKDADGKTIQIYKAVVGKTDGAWDVKVGDKLNVKAAVGIYNSTLQLRNTLTDEIEIISDEEPEPAPEDGIVKIAEALAGAEGTSFRVKGVVTLVDGRNIYIQDETGGIDLYLNAADSSVALGDTLIGTGDKTVFKGLPELKNAVIEKSSGLTLSAKETTIGALTAADVCTYVSIKDVSVTEVYDNNGAYSTPNITVKDADGKTIQIYKAVVGKTDGVWDVKVGDKLNVKAAVGIYNSTLQLRNTLTDEIEIISDEEPEPAPEDGIVKIAEALAGAEGTSFRVKGVVTLVDGRNIYIQDETGGIDLYLNAADSSVALGDTLIGTGDKTVFKGLPELKNAVIEKSSGLTLSAKETTIGALTAADVCTYVSIKDVSVTEVYDNNGAYSTPNITVKDANGKTIQIYKAVVGKTDGVWDVKVGDKLNVKAAVGIYNSTLQLRNTLTDEIEIISGEEPEPVDNGDLVTDLSQLKDGAQVSIYSPGHKTAISSKPNGDWYLKANEAKVEDNKVVNFTADMVWTVKKNEDGTYSFYAYKDDTRSITVWPSGNYAELSVNVETYPDNKWKLDPAKTENCWYISSPTVSGNNGPAYIEAYIRNDFEVFSGYFTKPSSNKFVEKEFALQFYLVNGEEAHDAYDDGEWDGVLNKGERYVIHNVAADSTIGLLDQANFSMKAIPSTVTDGTTPAGNGTYVFTVDTMGRYYSFMTGGKYLATNDAEEMLLIDPNEDGSVPENAKWFLRKKEGTTKDGAAVSGYIIYNKEASYGGTPVCIEYYSSVFSGWTFSTKNELDIYLFNFCKLTEDAVVYNDIVQDPAVLFDDGDYRYVTQDYSCDLSLDDLADTITDITITYECGSKSGTVENVIENNNKSYSFTIAAEDIDSEEKPEFLTITVTVTNSYGITYSKEKNVENIDLPYLEGHTPEPNEQTGDDKRPTVSVYVRNAGENPTIEMYLNKVKVDAVFENELLSYTPSEDMEDGAVAVEVTVTRADGKSATEGWAFIVGTTGYQLYFGQLHSHTTYSDGSGTLDSALEYVGSLPESANVDFVAFTDHSNYFDTTSAANPADAMNDRSLMTDASRALWEEYKNKVAQFNAKQSDVIAIAGYEMTWSGGPGHINSFNTDGLVSRNDAALNNKSGDAGMKLYYETMKKDNGETLHQFNHPGSTFGNFTDFSYWDEQTDDHMFLVEVGNGEGQIGAGGYYPSYEQYTLALDQGWHVAPTNNQDNHKGRWGNANDARDVILTEDFSEEGIYQAIRERRVYATEDKNLEIHYQLNKNPMGTILEDFDPAEKVNIQVTLYDPDRSDSISKVEVIGDHGAVAYTWNNAEELESGILSAELEPEYSYYYIRVTEADGDLAVTAPVWTGKTAKIGIEEVTYTPETALVNQPVTLHTALYNNEYPDATVKSITYTTGGSKVLGTDTEAKTLEGEGTLDVPFTFTPDRAKRMTVTVTAVIDYEGNELKVTKDVVISVRENEGPLHVTDIKDVMAVTEEGFEFAIEGVVTSNASGYDKDTAFFDCIYVQDETGGICCFPVSGNYKIGDKVHIEGYTDFYQGEPELQVESIEVIGSGTVEPQKVSAKEINDLSALGNLVTLEGTVESVEEANGLIQTIMVKDADGNVARVFIDGYITTSKEVENCKAGAAISATGLASYDNTWPDTDHFARIRIRDRKDVVCTATETPVSGVSLNTTELEMSEGDEKVLEASVTPEDASNKKLIWSSDNEDVVTVDENGKVTALKAGKAVITVTTEDGGYTATCVVTVTAASEPAKITYIVTEGADGSWTKGSGKDFTMRVKRSEADETCFDHFTDVKIDGKLIAKGKDYTAAKGSTIITLKASMLETLKEGSHTVTVIFNDGTAETSLKIAPKGDSGAPNTSDHTNTGWVFLMAGALLASVLAMILKRKAAR